MSSRSKFLKLTLLSAAALIHLDPNYLSQGGAAAPIWLAGAVVSHPSVSAERTCGRGADHQRASCSNRIGTTRPADELGADATHPRLLTWGCGGDLEWREAETASHRLTARTLIVCGAHDLNGPAEVRLTIRTHQLILRHATIATDADGFFDIRATTLTLEGDSHITSRAPPSRQPPFSASANLSLSAAAVEGDGTLALKTHGADFLGE